VEETNRRREIQMAYNEKHGITPETVKKAIRDGIETELAAHKEVHEIIHRDVTDAERMEYVRELEEDMLSAADNLDFEEAARIRDLIVKVQGKSASSQGMMQTVLTSKAKKKRRKRF
jgi:excinuclease ABC subunit B